MDSKYWAGKRSNKLKRIQHTPDIGGNEMESGLKGVINKINKVISSKPVVPNRQLAVYKEIETFDKIELRLPTES